ncbi:MAG: hypothetical protein AAGD96_20240 [Chloroflexota bacterium]
MADEKHDFRGVYPILSTPFLSDGSLDVTSLRCLIEFQRSAGFSFPSVLVKIQQLFESGDVAGARQLFDRMASLFRYEFQLKLGLPFRKHMYQRRGVFETTFVRAPSVMLDQKTIDEFEGIIERVGLSL